MTKVVLYDRTLDLMEIQTMRILTPCLIMLGTLVWPGMGLAIDFINGGWSTSFDYSSECSMSGAAGGVNCGDINDDFLNWDRGTQGRSGNYTEAVTAANNGDGDGGMGARFWVDDGTNLGTTRVRLSFPQQEPEIWLRWYQRYSSAPRGLKSC